MSEIDWDGLGRAAVDAAGRAYAPYSKLHVGAAAITDAGDIVTGCNVENASYGLTLCAECILVGNQRLAGASRIVALACRASDGRVLTPCGRCRQLLFEAGGPDLLVDHVRIAELLPAAFDKTELR